jgi:hypothetical protein
MVIDVSGVSYDSAPRQRPAATTEKSLQVSAYDRVSGLLIALLVIVGFFVFVLLLIWLTQRVLAVAHVVPVELLEAGGAEGTVGTEQGFEEPATEEVQELIEPELEDALESITDAVSTKAAHLENLRYAPDDAGSSGNLDRGRGGRGDADVIPRWERWEIRYNATSRQAYAEQLDFFRVELAATGGGKPLIEYATNLSAAKPNRKTGPSASEDRLYMLWQSGPLQRADRELLTAAGIDVRRRILVQFFPADVEQNLAQLEASYAQTRDATKIRKTVFGVREGRDKKYEFYVMEQQLRARP